MDFDVQLYQQTINEILPGLTMYVRDVNLPKKLAEKYIPDTIILERGYTYLCETRPSDSNRADGLTFCE